MSYDLGYGTPNANRVRCIGHAADWWWRVLGPVHLGPVHLGHANLCGPVDLHRGHRKNISFFFYSDRAQDQSHTVRGVTLLYSSGASSAERGNQQWPLLSRSNPVTNTRGQSPLIRAEFALIQTGFCHTAETAIGLRGVTTGQTWTGAHGFSSCTSVLVPTISGSSENSTKAASTAFAAGIGRRCRPATYSNATPLANGVATSGVGAGAARYDHVTSAVQHDPEQRCGGDWIGNHCQRRQPIAWNWAQTTAAQVAFKFGETTAATGGSGSQYLVSMATAALRRPIRSACKPVRWTRLTSPGRHRDCDRIEWDSGSGTTGSAVSITAGAGATDNAGGASSLVGAPELVRAAAVRSM